MLISGVQTLTLLDYPGKVAAILFTAGCNMRCGYCHNPELVLPERIKCRTDFIPNQAVLNFLRTRQGFLEGLVISGGEPTLQPDLITFMREVKALGFLIKLDTNGTNPELLSRALEGGLIDFFAMDIKASPDRYDNLTATKNNFDKIEISRDLIMSSGIDYEFRTTLIKGYHKKQDLLAMANFCRNAKAYALQNFRPDKTLDPAFGAYRGFTLQEMEDLELLVQPFVKKTVVRT